MSTTPPTQHAPRPLWKKCIYTFAWAVLILIGVIILGISIAFLWIGSSHGQKTIAQSINTHAASVLQLDALSLGFSGITLHNLRLYDSTQDTQKLSQKSSWCSIDTVELRMDWSALWPQEGRVRELCIEHIRAEAVYLQALPVYADNVPEVVDTETTDWRVSVQESLTMLQDSLPSWLPTLRIAHIDITASASSSCLIALGLLPHDYTQSTEQRMALPHISLNAEDIFLAVQTTQSDSNSTVHMPHIGASMRLDATTTASILPFTAATLNVTLQGSVVRPHIRWHSHIHGLVLEPMVQDASDTTAQCIIDILADVQTLNMDLTGQVRLDNIPEAWHDTPHFVMDFFTKAQYAPAPQEHAFNLHVLDIHAPLLHVQGSGAWQATAETEQGLLPHIDAELTCLVRDLGILRYIPNLPAPTAGMFTSTVQLHTNDERTRMDAAVRCDIEQMQWGEALAALAPIVGDTAYVHTDISLIETRYQDYVDLALALKSIDIQAKALQFTTQGDILATVAHNVDLRHLATEVQTRVNVHDLGAFVPDSRGAIAMSLDAQGTVFDTETSVQDEPLHLTVAVQSPRLDIQKQSVENIDIATDITAYMQEFYAQRPVHVQASLKASAASSMGALDVQLSGNIEHDLQQAQGATSIHLNTIQALFAGIQAQGNMHAFLTPHAMYPQLNGDIVVDVQNWQALSALVGDISAQQARVHVALANDKEEHKQSAQADISVQALRTHDDGPRVQELFLAVTAQDIFGQLTATAKGNIGKTQLMPELMWQGVTLQGTWKGTFEKPVGTLHVGVDALRYGAAAALQQAATRYVREQQETNPYGTVHKPSVQSLSIAGDIEFRAQAPALVTNVRVDGLGTIPLQLVVTLPLLHRSGMPPSIDGQSAMQAAVDWDGKLQDLWRFLPLADTLAHGNLALHASLQGPLHSILEPTGELTAAALRPLQPKASFTLTQGSITDVASGVEIQDMSLAVTLIPTGETKLQFTSSDGKQGTVTSEAALNIFALQGPLQATTSIRNFAPLHRNDIQAVLSGDIEVHGTIDAPNIAGTLSVDSGEVLLNEIAGTSIPSIDVINAELPTEKPKTQQAASQATAKGTSTQGSLAIDVHIPNRFFVRGMGIESEWRGLLQIKGTPQVPNITGDITSVRGDLSLLGKLFVINRGAITLPGGWPPQPMLDVALEYAGSDFTAIIAVDGSAQNPQINLSSQPSMPRDEIISYILFGRTPSQLSQGEVLQLALATASLTSGSSATGILSSTKDALGVDVLRIGSGSNQGAKDQSTQANPFAGPDFSEGNNDSSSSATLEAGKYVLDNVYVGVEQGMGENSSSAVIHIEVTKNIDIVGKTSGDGSEIGINWVWDY